MEYIHSTPSSILSILLIFTHLNFAAVCGLGRMLPLLKREGDSYVESYSNLIKVNLIIGKDSKLDHVTPSVILLMTSKLCSSS